MKAPFLAIALILVGVPAGGERPGPVGDRISSSRQSDPSISANRRWGKSN